MLQFQVNKGGSAIVRAASKWTVVNNHVVLITFRQQEQT